MPTLTALKAHLNIPASSTGSDNELQDILDAAIEVAENITGPVGAQSVTETHYGLWSPVLVLRQAPVLSLTSVSARQFPGDTVVAYNLADYELDGPTGIVRRVDGFAHRGDVTVTYSAGRAVEPASLALGILIIAGHLWETQRGTSPSALALQGGDLSPVGVSGFAIPNRALELLTAHRMPGVA